MATKGSTSKRPREEEEEITVLEDSDVSEALGNSDDCICLLIKGKAKDNVLSYLHAINAKINDEHKRQALFKAEVTTKWKELYRETCTYLDLNMNRFKDEELQHIKEIDNDEHRSILNSLMNFSQSGDKTIEMLNAVETQTEPVLIKVTTECKFELKRSKVDKTKIAETLQKLNKEIINIDTELCQLTLDKAQEYTKCVFEDYVGPCDLDKRKSLVVAKAWRRVCIRFRGLKPHVRPNPNPNQRYRDQRNLQRRKYVQTSKRQTGNSYWNVRKDKPRNQTRRQYRQSSSGQYPPRQGYTNGDHYNHRTYYRPRSRFDSQQSDRAPYGRHESHWRDIQFDLPDKYYDSERYHRNFPKFPRDEDDDDTDDDVFYREY